MKEKKQLALETKYVVDLYLIKCHRCGEVRRWDLDQTLLRLISPERPKKMSAFLVIFRAAADLGQQPR